MTDEVQTPAEATEAEQAPVKAAKGKAAPKAEAKAAAVEVDPASEEHPEHPYHSQRELPPESRVWPPQG
jgi:hypothetical protein